MNLPEHAPARRTDFQRRVYCFLGIPVDAISRKQVLALLCAPADHRSPRWLSTLNAQYFATAQTNAVFRDSLLQSDLSVIDGLPFVWIARALGIPIQRRIAGSDLLEALMRGEGGRLTVFFFGGPDGVAEMACKRLAFLSGPLTCAGSAFPGYGSVEDMSSPEAIERINRSDADFLVVALGAHKGQAWIERNRSALNVRFVSHLGAAVNFVASTLKRAPVWLQVIGLEWLWRIKEEPALWQRYWSNAIALLPVLCGRALPCAVYRLICVLGSARSLPGIVRDASAAPLWPGDRIEGNSPRRLKLSGSWTESHISTLRSAFDSTTRQPCDIELDVGEVEWVDSAFIALLLLLRSHQAGIGRSLSVLSASRRLCWILKFHCAEFLLEPACETRANRP